jgi:hypothetical protein
VFCEVRTPSTYKKVKLSPYNFINTVTSQICPCATRVKHYDRKAYGEADVQIHVFLILHYLEVKGQLHAPAALFLGYEPPVDCPQSRSRRYREVNILGVTGTRTPTARSISP